MWHVHLSSPRLPGNQSLCCCWVSGSGLSASHSSFPKRQGNTVEHWRTTTLQRDTQTYRDAQHLKECSRLQYSFIGTSCVDSLGYTWRVSLTGAGLTVLLLWISTGAGDLLWGGVMLFSVLLCWSSSASLLCSELDCASSSEVINGW